MEDLHKKAENKRLEGKNEGLVMFASDDVPLHFGGDFRFQPLVFRWSFQVMWT